MRSVDCTVLQRGEDLKSEKARANFVPLCPVSFLLRSAKFFADRTAVIEGNRSLTYGEFFSRVQALASGLKRAGISFGDSVGIVAQNSCAMLETHFAVPLIGAVLVPLSPQVSASALPSMLRRCNLQLLICESRFAERMRQGLEEAGQEVPVFVIHCEGASSDSKDSRHGDYGTLLEGRPSIPLELKLPDERLPLTVLFTSGTTGTPKGIIHTHRAAYLSALSNALSFGLDHSSVFLWTWPMFHTNGLSFVWAVTAVGGSHVCLDEPVKASKVFELIGRHQVSHFCVPPSVMNTLAYSRGYRPSFRHRIRCIVGGAAPASSAIRGMERLGIEVIHQYGNTECYGPATVLWRSRERDSGDSPDDRNSWQGTPTPVTDLMVADSESMQPVERDGRTFGEVMLRGNTILDGFLAESRADRETLSGGWLRTGDVAVWHPDGSIEIKDRSEDLIRTAGGTVSSVEVEEVLHCHDDIREAAVVSAPHPKLGETPWAFVAPKEGKTPSKEVLSKYCQSRLDRYKVPTAFIFQELPKTATGKIRKRKLRKLASCKDSRKGSK